MSFPNGEQRLELRDNKGTTLGFFLSADELSAQAAERERLHQQVADRGARREKLSREKEALLAEVANYEKILRVWEEEGIAPMTRKEFEHLLEHGVPFETVIAQVEEMLQSPPLGT
jgi:hypothetical protein